jgi:hypothetical protein
MCAQNVIVTPIKDLKPGLHNLCLHFIVLDVGRPSTVKDNQVKNLFIRYSVILSNLVRIGIYFHVLPLL